jgi:hypothetical protein
MNNFLENEPETLRLKARLKRAVESTNPPPYLEARIRSRIQSEAATRLWRLKWAPAAVAFAVILGGGIAYQLGHLRITTASQESYIAAVSNRVATLMRVGLRDHIHCAVFRKYPKDPPRVEALADKLGSQYRDLIPIVRKELPEGYRMVIAHECTYHERKFIHLAVKDDSRLLSLVIARKTDGESFKTEELIPALTQSGISFYRAGVQRFQIASFESRDHLIYFVSDLPQKENMRMMLAVAPQIAEFLKQKES